MLKRFLIICGVVGVLVVAGADAALAHARFDHSTPSPGAILQTAPNRVDIYTVQEMRKIAGANVITVTGPDGTQVDDGNTVVDDSNRLHFSVGLKPNIAPGRYLVSFKTLSDADGEMDHGSYAFYLGIQPTAAQLAQDKTLALTSQAEDVVPKSSSHTGLVVVIIVIVVIVLALAATGFTLRRRRGLRT